MTTSALTGTVTPFSSAPLWYLTRSTGVVSFLLLTAALVLGVASTQRALASPRWPRFATQSLHRNVALLGLGLLVVHIATTVLDSYVTVGWVSAVVPFSSSYKRLGVGLGALALDLLLLVVGTSLVRLHLPLRAWRAVHLSAYALWPVSLLHFLLTGTDARAGQFGTWLGLGAAGAVGAASAVRLLTPSRPRGPVASVAR
ncbi:MAG: ferric reductase-like transmembrane domain-containing protein [Mycobacteriales bacterium]